MNVEEILWSLWDFNACDSFAPFLLSQTRDIHHEADFKLQATAGIFLHVGNQAAAL